MRGRNHGACMHRIEIRMQLALAVFFCIIWIDDVTGSTFVEVTAHFYFNPSGRCDGCEFPGTSVRGCCDESDLRPINESCPVLCDPIINYCLRPVQSTGLICDPFIRGMKVFFDINSSNLIIGEDEFFGLPNPHQLSFDEAWVGIQIVYEILDCTIGVTVCESWKHLDTVLLDIDISMGTASPRTTYIGIAEIAQLDLSFLVRCVNGFYGQDCLTTCPNFESCAGCGLSGFTGEFCQFSTEDCSEVYCNGNGDCVVGSPICDCNPGFNGDRCQINIDDCEGVSCNNSGDCIDQIDAFVCDCNPGFTGDLCQVNIDDCKGVSCSNSGGCIDKIDGFVCDCNRGFTGDLCQVNIDDCKGVRCNISGEICIDRIDGFVCGRNDIGALVGGVVAAVLIVAIELAIVIVIVIIVSMSGPKRKLSGGTKDHDTTVTPRFWLLHAIWNKIRK